MERDNTRAIRQPGPEELNLSRFQYEVANEIAEDLERIRKERRNRQASPGAADRERRPALRPER